MRKGLVIASAISMLHKEKFVHGDIKPDNVFFDKDNVPFLADYGTAGQDNDWQEANAQAKKHYFVLKTIEETHKKKGGGKKRRAVCKPNLGCMLV